MSSVADELITKYTLKDDYSAGLAKIGRNSQHAAQQINSVQDSVSSSKGGGLMGAFSMLKGGAGSAAAALTAVVAGVTAVVGVGAGLIAAGKSAIDAFAPYDTLERTFTGIYGSAAKAKQMMSFLNSEAQKSNFLFSDLSQNAKLLALQGLKWGDYSDAIQGLAVRGGGTGEALGMATSTVTRIKGGDYGEAFENLRQFGYSRDVLTQMGLVFDKSGTYKGTMEQALAVIRKIGVENKAIVAAMNGGAEATLGNLTESFGLALGEAGKSIFNSLKGGIIGITDAISTAINSGAIKDTFSSFMDILTDGAGEINLTKVIASVLAGVETTAAVIRTTWEGIRALLNSPIVKSLMQVFLHVGAGVGIGALMDNQDFGKIYENSYKRNLNQMERYNSKPHDAKEPEPNASPIATPLQQIAENTKQTAKHTKDSADMGRHIFGGGDLGRMGISPLELKRGSRVANPNINVKVEGTALDAALSAAVTKIVSQMHRQGLIRYA